ncbi:restriction endonuclease [Pseudomonas sp. FSL R10-1350]|uniref:restriction endonuclease n=1 Tax=Pseudomonas sp. FSL R10-1350 TaxID=2662197 RepID=UPI0015B6395E
MNWREFEILFSELLVAKGYEIELMRGIKGGGLDVVAIKDAGEAACLRHCGKQREIAYRESCNFYHSRTSRRSERVSSEKRYYRYYQLP